MKTNGIKFFPGIIVLLFSLVLAGHQLAAQPDYDFRNPTLVSGTNNQVGAIYRFDNVKPGVDALVTITEITAGISVADIDAGSGYPEALQPTLDVQPNTKGYLEMYFQFLVGGTNTIMVQAEVPATCIDVDGWMDNDGLGNPLHEFDEIDMHGGYMNYQTLGGDLTVTQNGNWFTGINIKGVDYPGRDTSAKQAMFTVVNNNISDCIIRVGVDNQSTITSNRLRSVYFKKFFFLNGLLPIADLVAFNGVSQTNGNVLNWELTADCSYSAIVIEKSLDNIYFEEIGTLDIYNSGTTIRQTFTDYHPVEEAIYYRLRITRQGYKENYSEVIMLRTKNASTAGMKIYPNIISSGANLSIPSSVDQKASFQLVDYSGRILKQIGIHLQSGQNTIQLSGLNQFPAGNYVAIVRTEQESFTQKLAIR